MKKFVVAALLCVFSAPASSDHGAIMAFGSEADCEAWIVSEQAYWRSAESREDRRNLRSANRDNSAPQYGCVQETDGSWHVVATSPGSQN